MNLLAHAYLSKSDPAVLLGNMLGDDVKGMQIALYPPGVRVGIQLHRYIDSFTDEHPLISQAKTPFRPVAGLYAGALVDISMDYFLARDPAIHSLKEWQEFAQLSYQQLKAQQSWFVGGFKRYYPYLEKENWLLHYRDTAFIDQSMRNLLKRVGLGSKAEEVKQIFDNHKPHLEKTYQAFFPALENYVQKELPVLKKANGLDS